MTLTMIFLWLQWIAWFKVSICFYWFVSEMLQQKIQGCAKDDGCIFTILLVAVNWPKT